MILSAQSIRRPSWDEWYLSEAYKWAGRSRDPSTDAQLDMIKAVDAINGIESARVSLGMEKGK